MENLTQKLDEDASASKVQGYGPGSVTVFSLGLSGSLVWGIGVIPSIMALLKVKNAKQEIQNSEGLLRGLGLIKAGIVLAITGIFHFVLTIAMIVALVWAVNQIPYWVQDALDDGQVAGVDIAEILPPIDVESLGLDQSTLDSIESVLPEGQSLDSVDLNALLSEVEIEGIDTTELSERLLSGGTLTPEESEALMRELEQLGYDEATIDSLLPGATNLEDMGLDEVLNMLFSSGSSIEGLTQQQIEDMGLEGFGLEELVKP